MKSHPTRRAETSSRNLPCRSLHPSSWVSESSSFSCGSESTSKRTRHETWRQDNFNFQWDLPITQHNTFIHSLAERLVSKSFFFFFVTFLRWIDRFTCLAVISSNHFQKLLLILLFCQLLAQICHCFLDTSRSFAFCLKPSHLIFINKNNNHF